MQLHELKPIHKNKKRKRVGRGGKRGTYSGKGVKGQKSRAGRKMVPVIRGIIKRYPKLRGYKKRGVPSNTVAVNLEVLEKKFETGETVCPESLLKKRIIRRINGRTPSVKILGKGKFSKKLIIESCAFSESAEKKIKEDGSTIK